MACRLSLPFFIVCVILLQTGTGTDGLHHLRHRKKVTVAVYYECMCPYSINFITTQLWPTYRRLRLHMKVRLYPFGNGRNTTKTAANGTVIRSVSCQHGDNECAGNIVQSCVLGLYRRTYIQVNFVSCMMSAPIPYQAGKQCAARIGLEWGIIEKCSLSAYGKTLQWEMGLRTWEEHVASVPHIVINGIYNTYYTSKARENLRSLVCGLLGNRPTACKHPNAE